MFRSIASLMAVASLTFLAPGNQVEAAPSFPIIVDFDYCWDNAWPSEPCVGGPSAFWTINSDGTFQSSGGSSGTWSYSGSRNFQLQINYSSGTTYIGRHLGRGALEGPMQSAYGTPGTWVGQVR